MTAPGQPFVTLTTARSYDEVPVSFDWHDFLIAFRTVGGSVGLNFAVRPPRAQATGYQWVCVQAGVCSFVAAMPAWPTGIGSVWYDGSVVWNSVPCDATSFRTTIQSLTISVDAPLTYTDTGLVDNIETVLVSNGLSGNSYDIRCEVICVNGEKKEAVAVLPVQD